MTEERSAYTFEELSYARRVREIAISYRDQRKPKAVDHNSQLDQVRWLAHNPVESFYDEIVNTTTADADLIRAILGKPKA